MGGNKTRGPISSGQSDVPDVTQKNPGVGGTFLTHGRDANSIGDDYIQGKSHCQTTPGPDCFLDGDTRRLLVNGYQHRVTAAEGAFRVALTDLRVDQLISKDAEVGMITSMIIDALGGAALKGVGRAAKWLRGSSAAEVFSKEVGFAFDDGSSVIELLDRTKGANESNLNLAIKGAAEQGKRAATKAAGKAAAHDDEFDHNKAVSLSYIDQLRTNAEIAFQHQREHPPSVASDTELILLYHSWKSEMGHSTGMYKAELRAKLDRFKASPASKVGRTPRSLHHGSFDSMDGDYQKMRDKVLDTQVRDTKLVMQHYLDGGAPELVYYNKDYQVPESMPTAIWLDPKLDLDPAADKDFKPYKTVENEFAEAAMAKNEATWGVKYENRVLPTKFLLLPQAKSDKSRKTGAPVTPPASGPKSGAEPKPASEPTSDPAAAPSFRQTTMLDVPPATDPMFADLPVMVTE